jgi:hypothetical protein
MASPPPSPDQLDARNPADSQAVAPRIGLIRNPKSHRNKGAPPADTPLGNVTVVEPATRPEIDEALRQFAREGVEVLAISGGDGTIRDVLTRGMAAFGDHWPQILILPQGKTNALAVSLGIPGKWSLDAACDAVARGKTTIQHPIEVEDRDGTHPPVLGFLLGAGMFNVAIEAGQTAHRFGAFQGFAVAVTGLFGMVQALLGIGRSRWRSTYAMEIEAEGEDVPLAPHGAPGRRFVAGFTTLRRFPLGFRPFRDTGPSKGIDFFAIDAPLRRAIALIPYAMRGNDSPRLRRLGMHRHSARSYRIELGDPFILDGETFPAGRYQLRPGPALRFIVP